jgi:hypothetical protein
MQIDKIKKAAEMAKAKTNDKRWIAAIDKAVAGVESGWWIVTELTHCLVITTETGKTYFANGACQCKAFANGQACKHRALARLIEIAATIEETAPEAASLAEVVATKAATSHAELLTDVAESPRTNLIAEIKNIWPRVAPGLPLATELMARFGKNKLEMLDDDCLRRVRLAIAM